SYAPKKDIEAQDRRPFDLLVIINPKLKTTSKKNCIVLRGVFECRWIQGTCRATPGC
ncbi:hypothetical protein EE612_003432, partial [Oryza sativa]